MSTKSILSIYVRLQFIYYNLHQKHPYKAYQVYFVFQTETLICCLCSCSSVHSVFLLELDVHNRISIHCSSILALFYLAVVLLSRWQAKASRQNSSNSFLCRRSTLEHIPPHFYLSRIPVQERHYLYTGCCGVEHTPPFEAFILTVMRGE